MEYRSKILPGASEMFSRDSSQNSKKTIRNHRFHPGISVSFNFSPACLRYPRPFFKIIFMGIFLKIVYGWYLDFTNLSTVVDYYRCLIFLLLKFRSVSLKDILIIYRPAFNTSGIPGVLHSCQLWFQKIIATAIYMFCLPFLLSLLLSNVSLFIFIAFLAKKWLQTAAHALQMIHTSLRGLFNHILETVLLTLFCWY